MPTLKDERAAARDKGLAIIAGAKAAGRDLSSDELSMLNDIEAEVKDFDERIERAEQSEAMFKSFEALGEREAQPASTPSREAKSLGEHFVKSVGAEGLKGLARKGAGVAAPEWFGVKANSDNQVTGGPSGSFEDWLVDIDRSIQREKRDRLYVADLLGSGSIQGQSIRYYLEGDFEGDFATVAEGGQKPQVHVTDPTPQSDSVTKIAAWIRFTDEALEDLGFWVSEINNRLLYELAVEEENQLLNGAAVGTDLRGVLNRSGVQTETSAGGTDDADALFRAMTKIDLATNYTADALVINPLDYQRLRLAKDGNDQYYAGGMFSGQYGQGGIMENPPVWGLRTVVTPAVAQGLAVVGAWNRSGTVYRKGGVRVESTNSHASDFTTNHVVTRVEERLALAVRQPKGFVKVSLSNSAS